MNTTVLFAGGLMLGVLVTLTIVSHMYSTNGNNAVRPSTKFVRPSSSKRDPLTVGGDVLKPDESLEVLLRGELRDRKTTGRQEGMSGHDKMDASFSAKTASVVKQQQPGVGTTQGQGQQAPRKKSKAPLEAGPSSWVPGGRGGLDKYAKKAQEFSSLFGGGSTSATSTTGTSSSRGGGHSDLADRYRYVPYHRQAHKPPVPPKEISYDSVEAGRRPDITMQRAAHEKDNLKLHLCNSVFEAYSASYLTTKAHMLDVKSETYNLTWVNCEMASFIHMKHSNNFLTNADGKGMIMQSLDVLDFSVIHLSAFERSSRRWKDKLWRTREERKTAWHNIDEVKETALVLEQLVNPKITGKKLIYSPEAQRTVVVMPFLGGAMGAGHSELGNRFEYLKACFWSFYEFVPNIVAGVSRQEDVDWAFKESGLPFYDIILLPDLPKSAGLPVGTTQQVKKRLQSGQYDFDYIFFTESDQILITRELQLMYENLKRYPHRMLLPHRLMPYSDRVMKEVHQRHLGEDRNAWMNQSCCMPRQNCGERKSWKSLREPDVPVVNYHGLNIPLGNVNFLDESYRYCKLGQYVEFCP
jgi:hypothetical protein